MASNSRCHGWRATTDRSQPVSRSTRAMSWPSRPAPTTSTRSSWWIATCCSIASEAARGSVNTTSQPRRGLNRKQDADWPRAGTGNRRRPRHDPESPAPGADRNGWVALGGSDAPPACQVDLAHHVLTHHGRCVLCLEDHAYEFVPQRAAKRKIAPHQLQICRANAA